MAYAIWGARKKALSKYDKESTILSIFGHEANPSVLQGILQYLTKHGFSFVSTDDIFQIQKGELKWHPRLVWITYDDGWLGMESLLPVLERFNAPITVFISPRETDRGYAWARHVKKGMFIKDGTSLFELSANKRYELIEKKCGEKVEKRELADWDEIQRISNHPLVTIESHTNTHLSCSHCPQEEILSDIEKAKDTLLEKGLSRSRLVCYPFGHYTKDLDAYLIEKGFLPVHSDPGVMTITGFGNHRNAFHQWFSLQENIGRILGAWPKSRFRSN